MAINPKSFMEFFEKEFNVEFVDANTGKRALDTIAENERKKICEFCKWASKGDGETMHKDDRVCVNGDSDFVTEFVSGNYTCRQWEAKNNDK